MAPHEFQITRFWNVSLQFKAIRHGCRTQRLRAVLGGNRIQLRCGCFRTGSGIDNVFLQSQTDSAEVVTSTCYRSCLTRVLYHWPKKASATQREIRDCEHRSPRFLFIHRLRLLNHGDSAPHGFFSREGGIKCSRRASQCFTSAHPIVNGVRQKYGGASRDVGESLKNVFAQQRF